MKDTPYLVEWVDSYGCSSTWESVENCRAKPLLCRSVGWIVHRDKNCVVIVPHMTNDDETATKQGCGDMTIPTAAILRMVPVTIPVRSKRAA